MIQRIQSLFLLGALILIGFMFFFPLAKISTVAGELDFIYRGISQTSSPAIVFKAYPLAILLTIVGAINLLCIFLFKKRNLQMRVVIFNLLCMFGASILIYFSINTCVNEFNAIAANYSIVSAFPLLAAVLNYLAARNIRKDEALIRSMDRIR